MFYNSKVYYVCNLLINGLILSFYAVMAFTPHYPCLTASGTNVTKGFEFAFRLGFFVHAADFTNIGFFDYYIRSRVEKDIENRGIVLSQTLMLETVYFVMEWGFRSIIFLVTIL